MKRPGPLVFLLGNPVSVTLISIFALYCAYEWWIGQAVPVVVIVAFIAAAFAGRLNNAYEKYRRWKREWDAMEGRAPARGASQLLGRSGPIRIVLGLSVWAMWGYFTITDQKQPALLVALFWLTTLALVIAGVYRLLRRGKSPRRAASRDVAVTQCVSLPRQSPGVRQAFAALPEYCRPLLQAPQRSVAPIAH